MLAMCSHTKIKKILSVQLVITSVHVPRKEVLNHMSMIWNKVSVYTHSFSMIHAWWESIQLLFSSQMRVIQLGVALVMDSLSQDLLPPFCPSFWLHLWSGFMSTTTTAAVEKLATVVFYVLIDHTCNNSDWACIRRQHSHLAVMKYIFLPLQIERQNGTAEMFCWWLLLFSVWLG